MFFLENDIGSTPLLRLSRLLPEGKLYAKAEYRNPGGSVKDRTALAILDRAEAQGLLSPGATVIEATSGNTGIGLAWICARRRYRCIIVMPDTMSQERQRLLLAYGAELVLTPGHQGMQGAVEKARELAASIPSSFLPDQFSNPAAADIHFRTTGPEIWADVPDLDYFVAGVGTGGTFTGTGRYLKARNPAVRLIAMEPADSPLLSAGRTGNHGIQGIGPNFLPPLLDRTLIDEVIPVTQADACQATRELACREGILAGISSGAALHAALVLARRAGNRDKTIVTILPDSGERYLSTGLFP